MLKRVNWRKLLVVGLAGVMIVAVLALAGCSCSAQSSSAASSGSMSASDVSASSSAASSESSNAESSSAASSSAASSSASSGGESSSSASSSAQPTIEVPNLVGMSMADAQAVCDGLGLALEATGDLDGTITTQDPDAGAQADQGATITVTVEDANIWTDAPSAGEAAQAAGVDSFDVVDSVKMGDKSYADPKFSYTEGAVQAVYDAAASGVIVRKTDAAHASLATDRDLSEFALNWTQDANGIEVKCFGAAQDAATVIEWSVGTDTFGATFQGYGGEEMTMTPDDITALVVGIK